MGVDHIPNFIREYNEKKLPEVIQGIIYPQVIL